MLIHGRRCHENDSRTVGSDEGMQNDLLKVLFILVQWDMLVVQGLRQGCIICAEEDDLGISALPCVARGKS